MTAQEIIVSPDEVTMCENEGLYGNEERREQVDTGCYGFSNISMHADTFTGDGFATGAKVFSHGAHCVAESVVVTGKLFYEVGCLLSYLPVALLCGSS